MPHGCGVAKPTVALVGCINMAMLEMRRSPPWALRAQQTPQPAEYFSIPALLPDPTPVTFNLPTVSNALVISATLTINATLLVCATPLIGA